MVKGCPECKRIYNDAYTICPECGTAKRTSAPYLIFANTIPELLKELKRLKEGMRSGIDDEEISEGFESGA